MLYLFIFKLFFKRSVALFECFISFLNAMLIKLLDATKRISEGLETSSPWVKTSRFECKCYIAL